MRKREQLCREAEHPGWHTEANRWHWSKCQRYRCHRESLTLVGTLQDINTALARGLSFMPRLGFLGKTQLQIHSNDKGNSGAGVELTDTDLLSIEIADLKPANDAPVNHLPPAIVSTQPLVT